VSLYGCDTCQFKNFYLKIYCHVAGHDCVTSQAIIGCFQFSPSIWKFDSIQCSNFLQ